MNQNDLNLLYQTSIHIDPKYKHQNKYCYLATEYNQSNYRIYNIRLLLENQDRFEALPSNLVNQIKHEGKIICIFDVFKNEKNEEQAIQLLTRSFSNESKDMRWLTFTRSKVCLYGLAGFPATFVFGTPVLLCEGTADRDFLARIYPYTCAILNKRLSQDQFAMISCLTDKVILAYDNDKAGQDSYHSDMKKCNKAGIKTTFLKHSFKDAGDILDVEMKQGKEEAVFFLNQYELNLQEILRGM